MISLKVRNLNFGYKSSPRIFNDLNCEINDVPFIHINGISGSGKTTLFKIFAGFIDASYDELTISGLNISRKMKPYDRNIAMVFQKSGLWQHLTVEKNIKLAWNKEIIPENILNKWIDDFRLNKFINKKTSKISAGEQQRVEIARALASGKKILILDEPFAFQDKINQDNLIRLIEEYRKITDGVVIFSTHSADAREYFSIQETVDIQTK